MTRDVFLQRRLLASALPLQELLGEGLDRLALVDGLAHRWLAPIAVPRNVVAILGW